MAFTVFPERMDKLDRSNPEVALGVLENYITYMQERVEFSFTNMFRTVSGAGTSTAEIIVLLATLSNALSALTGTVNQMAGTLTGLQTTVGTHTSQITALQTGKQDVLTFDNTPTEESANPVTSDGIYTVDDGFDTRITALEDVLTAAGPICYIQPQDVTVEVGESFTLSVRVLGATSYKWEHYYSSSWIEPGWDGHDTDTMTIPSASVTNILNGRQIRCTITGDGWTIYSRIATVHVTST